MGRPSRPPPVAQWLLARIVQAPDREYVLGDVADEFQALRTKPWGAVRAPLRYWRHVLQSVIPSIKARLRAWRHQRVRYSSFARRRREPMHALLHDLRFAVRVLRRSPVFTFVTIVTLALGIGANTAIFSVVRGVLLAPLPYHDPGQVVVMGVTWTETASGRADETHGMSEPELFDFRRGNETLEGIGAYYSTATNLTGSEGDAERVPTGVTTADVFTVLGVGAALGRIFTPDEDLPSSPRVALLGHDLWQRRYAGDSSILGRDIMVNGIPRTVVGVMEPGFRLPASFVTARSQLWLPIRFDEDNLGGRGGHYLDGVARLKPGVTVEQVESDLLSLGNALTEQGLYRQSQNFRGVVSSVDEFVVGNVRPALLVLFGAVALVLLIACANVANLMLARGEARKRELAVRAALGAGRGALGRQILTEAVVLGLAGGLAGLALAQVGIRALIAFDPASVPRLSEVRLDVAVLAYATIVSLGTGLLFGLAPALRGARGADLQGDLKDGGRGAVGGARGHRVQRALVGTQIGLAVMLVIGATLAIKSFGNLVRIDPGFETSNVLTMRLSIPASDYPDAPAVSGYYQRLLERVRELPGVRQAAAVRLLPLAESIGDWSIEIEGREEPPGGDFDGDWQVVSPGYFETMRIPLKEGRFIEDRDRFDGHQIIVINESMAELYWPGESALGKRVRMGGDQTPWIEIVGVVGDVRHEGISGTINSKFYRPHDQFARSAGFAPNSMRLVIHTEVDPLSVVSAVRREVRTLDPNVPVANIETMDDVFQASVTEPRFTMMLLLTFGGVALVLASVGVYGVISFSMSERTHELGLRRALGASGRDVVTMVVRQGMAVVVLGVVAGLAGAFWVTGFMSSLLYEVGARDPATFIGVPLLLGVVALIATLMPARRAVTVEPIVALREE